MLRLNRRPESSKRHPRLLKLAALSAFSLASFGYCPAAPAGDGAPWLNAVGRFLGVGYSQHGYHSPHARPAAVVHNRPATAYPSSHLQQIYLPAEYAAPPRQHFYGAMPYAQPRPHAGASTQQPTLAPVPAAPVEPPPKWLEQYLKDRSTTGNAMGDSAASPTSPSDRGSGRGPALQTFPEPIQAEEIDLLPKRSSPYDDNLLPEPNRRPADQPGLDADLLNDSGLPDDSLLGDPGDELLLDDDSLLNGTSDGDDLLGADARYRVPHYVVPRTQSTTHRYTPFH